MKLINLRAQGLLLLTMLVATFLRFYRLWELPPGLWSDEAYYGVDALRVLRTGYFSAFFPQNGGREPLFIYMQSAALAIWGVYPWVVRVVPALVGIATVPLVYVLARQLFGEERRGEFVGLAAAAGLAVLYWHVNFSRLGFRAILLPAVSTVAVYYFWRGWKSGRRAYFLWSGIALGASLYTYLSARLLPFILIGFVAVLALFDRLNQSQARPHPVSAKLHRAFIGLGLALAVAAIVAVPLAADFYWHPDDLFGRAGSVALTPENISESGAPAGTTPAQLLAQNALRVAGMFVFRGDMNARHNLPGRPALDPVSALGLVTALGVGIWRFRTQPAYPLLFIWLLAMVLPSVLSTEAPHFLRSIGAIPPLIVLVGDGLTRLWQKLLPRLGAQLLVILVLVVGGLASFHDYFQVWASDPELYQSAFDTNATFLQTHISQQGSTSDILLPLRLFGDPVLQFLLAREFPRQQVWPDNNLTPRPLAIVTSQGSADRQWVVLHKDDSGVGTVYFPDIMADVERLRSSPAQPIVDSRGQRVGSVIPLSEKAKGLIRSPRPTRSLSANFGNEVRLLGYNFDSNAVQPNQIVELALYWQPLADLDRDYRIFVHIVDADSIVQAQWDSQPDFGYFTTGLWKRGIVVADLYPIQLPTNLKPGDFRFEVGWVSFGEDRLPLLDREGRQIDDKLVFGQVVVAAQTDAPAGMVAK